MLDTAETLERAARRKRLFKIKDDKPDESFTLEKSITRDKKSLPRGVLFDDIYTQRSKDPQTDGLAYTHIFPQGVSEQTLIHLQDGSEHKQTLLISTI